METKKCKWCGKELLKNTKFCSHSCACSWANKNIKKKKKFSGWFKRCAYCGNKIYVTKSTKIRTYCSYHCYMKDRWQRKGKKSFNLPDKHDEKHPRWKGGVGCGYIRKTTIQILKENNRNLNLCELCGNEARLIHHIDGNRQNNDPNNLISLCESCHMKVHGKGGCKKYQNEWIRKIQEWHNNIPKVAGSSPAPATHN